MVKPFLASAKRDLIVLFYSATRCTGLEFFTVYAAYKCWQTDWMLESTQPCGGWKVINGT